MADAILVPQVGQDLTEAKIIELHVKLGDTVKKGDLVAVVESEKASFEVEAFSGGEVIDLPYKQGDIAKVLEPLMHLGSPGEAVPGAGKAPEEATAPAEKADRSKAETAAKPANGAAAPETPAPQVAASPTGGGRASPVARRVAAQHGLDVSAIAGSGPRGAVVLKDVSAAVAMQASSPVASGGSIELRTLQEGHGSPIVFIHGFGADLSSWRPMVALLGVGLPIMALDLPGHGASRMHGASDFPAIVEAVGQRLHALNGGAHLVGHSLGAAVAAALTERGDLDVRSLTLISPAGLGASVDGAFVDGFLSARSEPALAAWMQRLVGDPGKLAPVLVRATMAAREGGGLVEAQTRVARGVFEGGTQLFSVASALAHYQGPCTVIAGRDDAIIPYRETDARIPANVALHRLERVGHLPQVEAPELVSKLITRTVRAAG